MKNILKTILMLMAVTIVIVSCEKDEIGPIINLSDGEFVSAEFTNPSTADPVELTGDNAEDVFEEFTWSKSDYGVQIPLNYTLEIDTSGAFNGPEVLATTAQTSAALTVDDFNDAVLTLGFPAFEEVTVNLRVRTNVVGAEVDMLYSNPISRTVTAFRLSNCGDYCTVGIIGDATAGGWDTDTDMLLADPTGADRSTWTVMVYLTANSVKFRASDAWDVNWGDAAFPSGTGTQNGPNIPVNEAGYYKVTFNDKTGEYNFELLAEPSYTSIGVIGDATAGGWDSDTDLTQDANDAHVWAGSITLTDGEAKFRADDDWAVNWGAEGYPSGFGVQNGPNIPVEAGTYAARIHDVSGRYAFQNDPAQYTSVGVIGDATAGGWDSDTDLIQNPTNPYLYSGVITLTDGELKFRADDDWADNWGASTFPSGIGIKNGPNIPVDGGTYVIHFDSGTGEYVFLK